MDTSFSYCIGKKNTPAYFCTKLNKKTWKERAQGPLTKLVAAELLKNRSLVNESPVPALLLHWVHSPLQSLLVDWYHSQIFLALFIAWLGRFAFCLIITCAKSRKLVKSQIVLLSTTEKDTRRLLKPQVCTYLLYISPTPESEQESACSYDN